MTAPLADQTQGGGAMPGAAAPGGAAAVRRLCAGPILAPGADRRMGVNLNGPSLIRTPGWLACALGRYHLYFAHHIGSHIRLAYADDLAGPWTVHPPGVLDLAQTPAFHEHIASPDVHVDEARRELRMYFHGISDPGALPDPEQTTAVAHSFDGITFAARPERLGDSYFRAWPHDGAWYALSLGGLLWRSGDGISPFERGHRPEGLGVRTRHLAVLAKGQRLWVAWSEVGDAPERLYLGAIDLSADWRDWRIAGRRELLRPERVYEGADLPIRPSVPGIAVARVHELRDPAFFSENGTDYLLYSVAGESGIAIAEISGLEAA